MTNWKKALLLQDLNINFYAGTTEPMNSAGSQWERMRRKCHRVMIWCCCQFSWFLKMSRRSCEAPPFPCFNQIGDKSLQSKANQRSVTGGTRLWNEFISLESLVWSCEQNIFLYSSASKSQCNNVFQHNLKWWWRKKTTWQRSRGCQWLSYIAHALMDYLIISPCRRSALLMGGNMAFTSLKE